MLKYISDTKHMNLVVSRLEDIYMRDEMTGLYNQNSFPKLSSEVITHALEYNESILVAVFNLNDLKGINDTYGHKEGNFAIQVLGHALENSIKEKDICARISGDIFYLIGSGYNGNGAMTLTSKVNRYLENYNKLHTKNYQISVSNGYVIELPQNIFDLQELIDVANTNLYLEKKKN
jgi:diguanylate cyclase (GGDEF)-like protein